MISFRRGGMLRYWTLWLGSGLALGLALSITWSLLIEPVVKSDRVVELVIPAGTAKAVAAGQLAPFIPASLALTSDRELVVKNEDDVTHRVGLFSIEPGATATIRADPTGKELTCTVHPSGYLNVTVDHRPGPLSVILVGIIAGLPFGALFGLISLIAQRLGTEPPEDTPSA